MVAGFCSLKNTFIWVNKYLIVAVAAILFNNICSACSTKTFEGSKIFAAPNNEFNRISLNSPDLESNFFLRGDYIYSNNIRTVLFYREGWEMAPAQIRYNSDERLFLRFDDLDADFKNYSYTIIHCDANWKRSPLQEFEYIDGFYEDQIRDYARSVNTVIPYTQYTLEFPSANLRPRLSGNYILKVYINGDRDNVVFTRRFMIYEQRVVVEGTVMQANLLMFRETHQQLAFSINTLNYPISNPHRDLKLVITQNGRWDNAIVGIQPRIIQGNRFIYDYERELLFEGGNEFRRFDTRSLRYVTERVANISSTHRHYEVLLIPDVVRASRHYTSDGDINGRFSIKTHDARDHLLETDYAWVHFSLTMPEPVINASVHLLGALTDWTMTTQNELTYNHRLRKYEINLLLKQGLYNYLFAIKDSGKTQARLADIEGSHSETENEYTIFVYHRRPGDVYDRLVGVRHFNSSVR